MGLLFLIGAAIVTMFVTGVVRTGRGRIRAHGLLVLLWRWHTGQPWHGKPVTDRGWNRPGKKALTATGHASRFHYRRHWEQVLMRTTPTVVLVLAAWGFVVNRRVTEYLLVVLACALVLAAAWRARARWRRRRERRTWVLPTTRVIAAAAGHAVAANPSWLKIERDPGASVKEAPRRAELTMGPNFEPDPKEEERIVRNVSLKLGIEAAEATWHRAGQQVTLILERSQPPPTGVTWDDISEAVMKAGPHELVAGIGKRDAVVRVSLTDDAPHLAVSMGSGAGKSTLAGFLVLQGLMRGDIALVLDSKWISIPWLKDLPNVAYARTPEQLHHAMVWVGGEVSRRNEVAFRGTDYAGNIHANVGPRLWVIAEELNLAETALKNYWSDIRDRDDPKRSPAFDGLGAVSFAGRQISIHMVLIGQMLTAAVTGRRDSSVKESCGIRFLARYGPPTWKTVVGDRPMPPSPSRTGRVQVVTAGEIRETQVPFVPPLQARELVLAGQVTPCPAGMPYVGAVTPLPELAAAPPDQQFVTSPGPAGNGPGNGSALVTIEDAIAMQVTGPTPGAVRTAMSRSRSDGAEVPAVRGQRGTRNLFDPAELARWEAGRRS